MLNFSARRSLPVIVQSEASECGLACLAMVASFHGHRMDLNTLRRQHQMSLNGVTLKSLVEIARHLNLTSRSLRVELEDLGRLKLPAILHWDMNHFVVLNLLRGVVLFCTTRHWARNGCRGKKRRSISQELRSN